MRHDKPLEALLKMLKMKSVKTSASWSSHPLSNLTGMMSGLAAFHGLVLQDVFTSAVVRQST